MNPKVDQYLSTLKNWNEEVRKLRMICLDCFPNEDFKWGAPCYTFGKNNVVLIHAFKHYCAILFFQGALLKDEEKILIRQTENVNAGRQVRFTNLEDILQKEGTLKAYIFEAIENEKQGFKVTPKPKEDLVIPEEFQKRLDHDPTLNSIFHSLTPGRQRAYILYFSAAKQSATRESRIDRSLSRILKGKGLDDCICGLSKRMPQCDGSHKLNSILRS